MTSNQGIWIYHDSLKPLKIQCVFHLLFIIWICGADAVALSNQTHKNVLFIIVDDLRPALGCFGDTIAITPNIDRFANRSFIFRRAYAQQSICAPSRNSLLTSRRPDTLRLYDFNSYWRTFAGNFTTLPQYLKSLGYHTHSIGKVFHPGKSSNFTDDYPYSWSQPTYHPSTETYMNDAVCFNTKLQKLQKDVFCPVTVKYQPENTLPDMQSLTEAKRYLARASNRSQPFFLAVGFHKPHIPFRFPIKYLKLHNLHKFWKPQPSSPPYGLPIVAFNPFNDIRHRDDVKTLNISFPFGPIPDEFAARMRQGYYSSVSYIDTLIGELLKTVDFSTTIIILTSDHGWSLGEHAEWAKYSNYDIALRVPVLIYTPEIKLNRPRKIDNVAELVDIFPTIVQLASLPPIQSCAKNRSQELCTEGKSLFQQFVKERDSVMREDGNVSYAISQYPRPGTFPTLRPDSDQPRLKNIKIMGYSIKTNRYRYTNWIKFSGRTFKRSWRTSYGEEFYDHSIDPFETINLAGRPELTTIKLNLKKLLKENIS